MAEPARFLGFEDAARLAGHCRWFEVRLFEILGGWAEAEDDPRVKLILRAHSFRHAWHAELWEGRLPVSGPLEKASLTVPAGDRVAAVIDGLASAPRRSSGIERLAGLYRVVMPRMVDTYTEHLKRAAPVTEGPTLRWLPLLLADEVAACQQGERVVADLVQEAGGAEQAPSVEADLARVVGQGGLIPSSVGLLDESRDTQKHGKEANGV